MVLRRHFALKLGIWLAGLTPAGWLVRAGFRDQLTADPVKYLTHFTGRTTIVILFLTLAVTPVRKLTGWNALARSRRLIGLFAFGYAVIHLLIYFVFDRGLVFTELGEDILKRPYITLGFTAWTILLVLAVTSPGAVVRKLGGVRWRKLHRLIYLAAPLALVHFAWAQKKDIAPLVPFALLAALVVALRLAARLPVRLRGDRPTA